MPLEEDLLAAIELCPELHVVRDVLMLGDVEVDLKTGIYHRVGSNSDTQTWKALPKSDLCVLKLLLSKLDKVTTRAEILDIGWANKVVSLSSICVSVHNIRNLLKMANLDDRFMVKNFSGVGYGVFKIKKTQQQGGVLEEV